MLTFLIHLKCILQGLLVDSIEEFRVGVIAIRTHILIAGLPDSGTGEPKSASWVAHGQWLHPTSDVSRTFGVVVALHLPFPSVFNFAHD